MIMPFGKYKDQKVSDIPASYINCCLRKLHFKGHQDLFEEMLKEAKKRPYDRYSWAMGQEETEEEAYYSNGVAEK
jgi:uncharacterized protein (DUF3820 family)